MSAPYAPITFLFPLFEEATRPMGLVAHWRGSLIKQANLLYRRQFWCSLFAATLLLFLFLADARAAENIQHQSPTSSESDDREGTDNLISFEYKGQILVGCDSKDYPIPAIIAYPDRKYTESLFVTIRKGTCSSDNYRVDFGVTKFCEGQNFCARASFSSTVVADAVPFETLSRMLDLYAQKVQLEKSITGYFVPAQCFSYCNQAQMVWYQQDRIFVVGVKDAANNSGTSEFLREMANSFIIQQGETP